MKPVFGNRDAVEIVSKLRDPKIMSTMQDCIAANNPQWVWPIQLRKYKESDVLSAVQWMNEEAEKKKGND